MTAEEVLNRINAQKKAIDGYPPKFIYVGTVDEYKVVVEALEKQIPKKPNFVVEKYEHHEWLKDKDGRIDKFAMSLGFHNGPMCSRCYKFICVHCEGNYEEIINEECDCSHYECPNCHTQLNNNEHRCKCGQALDWSET